MSWMSAVNEAKKQGPIDRAPIRQNNQNAMVNGSSMGLKTVAFDAADGEGEKQVELLITRTFTDRKLNVEAWEFLYPLPDQEGRAKDKYPTHGLFVVNLPMHPTEPHTPGGVIKLEEAILFKRFYFNPQRVIETTGEVVQESFNGKDGHVQCRITKTRFDITDAEKEWKLYSTTFMNRYGVGGNDRGNAQRGTSATRPTSNIPLAPEPVPVTSDGTQEEIPY